MELIEVWQRQKYGEKNMNPYYIVKVYRHTPEQPYEKMFGKEFEKTGRWSTIDAVFATRTGVWLPQEMRLVLGIDGYNARVQDRAAFFNEVAQTLGLYGGGPSTESEIAESPRGLLQVNAELRATDEKGDYFWRKFVDEQTLQGMNVGVKGTPFSVIWNQKTGKQMSINGAYPYENVKTILGLVSASPATQ